MPSRDYTMKLNQWIISFTGNDSGKTPFGNLSEILLGAFPTDELLKPFLIRAFATSPKWLFLWKPEANLVDFNGKKYNENILTNSAHVYKLQNKLDIPIYAVDPNLKSDVKIDNTDYLPDYLKGKEGTKEYYDYINSIQSGFGSLNISPALLIGVGLIIFLISRK